MLLLGKFGQGLAVGLAGVAVGVAIPGEVLAQAGVGLLPPIVSARDNNGVDLIGGSLSVPSPTLVVGNDGSGISRKGLGYTTVMDNLTGLMTAGWYKHFDTAHGTTYLLYDGTVNVSVNGISEWFYFPNRNSDGNGLSVESGYYCPGQIDGSGSYYYTGCAIPANLPPAPTTLNCTGSTCTFTMRDGTVAIFTRTPSYGPIMYGLQGDFGRITQLRKPNGEILNYSYGERTGSAGMPAFTYTMLVMRQVTSSLGWTVRYQYSSLFPPDKISVVNATIDYCDPNANNCSAADQAGWPTLLSRGFYPNSSGTAVESVSMVNSVNTAWPTFYISGYTSALGGNVSTTLYPQSHSDPIVDYWNNDFKIKTLTRDSKTWSYQYSPNDANGISTTTVTNPNGTTRLLTFYPIAVHPGTGRYSSINTIQDELGRTTKYAWYSNGFPLPYIYQVIPPEATYNGSTLTGGYKQYSYDSRWNLTQIATHPKGGGTAIITSAAYPPTCTNTVTCNKPTSITDANGNTTTYTYDPVHGGMSTETKAPVNGVQTQTRYSYSQITPYLKAATGAMVAQSPVWQLTGISTCRTMTLATCVGTPDEIKTAINYGSDNTHPTYNNVLPVSRTVSAGDGSLIATTTYTYDSFGRVIITDGPRTDVDDRTYTTYDSYGRPLLLIDPDPDGTGPLPRHATRTTYDAEGRALKVEDGTTSTTTGSDFVTASFKRMTYDLTTGLMIKTEVGQP